MDNAKKKTITKMIISISLALVLAIFAGFFTGNLINNKYFPKNGFLNINGDELRDNVATISTEGKTPDKFSSAIAFQIAEENLLKSTKYTVIGEGTIDTSAGVSQTSYTEDIRDGDSLYIGFTTYSSIIKASKQAHYKINGDVTMYNGVPSDSSLQNVKWGDSTTYTWEGYKDAFGKYANRNCCYIVSTKTVTKDSGFSLEEGLYKATLELDPQLGGANYIKQIGTNMGVDYTQVVVNEIKFTFWLNKEFQFVKIEKYESYTVPYAGINLTMYANITTNFDIS